MIDRTQNQIFPFLKEQKTTANSVVNNLSDIPVTNRSGDLNIKSLVRGVWTRSIIGLVLIAILSTTTFFIISGLLSLNEQSGTIINISGRQRMLSQRGALFALRLSTSTNAEARADAAEKLKDVVNLMEKSHTGLVEGSEELGLPSRMSPEINTLYFSAPHKLDQQVRDYVNALRNVLADAKTGNATPDNANLEYILKVAPTTLLSTLNMAVQQYENEANTELQNAIRSERMVYATTLLVLLLELLFIYRPLVNRVKNTTRAFLRQLQFSDSVVDTSQALIIGLNQAGRVQLFNKHSEQLTGWESEQIIGERFMDSFVPTQEQKGLEEAYDKLLAGHPGEKMETTLTTKSGENLTIEWSNTLLADPDKDQPGIILATGVDITERKKHSQALQKALDQSAKLSSRLQEEVSHAALLQQALLPEPSFNLPGIQGFARLTTSTEVGGDYYDYYQVSKQHSIFIVGDVSGHGVASGTLVSAAKMAVHQLENLQETDPAKMLEHINASLLTASHESMFMTMVCFSLDSHKGIVRMANAGHVFPYIWIAEEGEWCMIEAEGLPLGKVQTPRYEALEFDLEVGDKLFVYTDGIIEEESPQGEQFGFERLENLLYDHAQSDITRANAEIFIQLQKHCKKEIFSDDVTVMLVEHTERTDADAIPTATLNQQKPKQNIVQLNGSELIAGKTVVNDYLSRQYTVASCTSQQLNSLLQPLLRQGVRRILLEDQMFLKELDWAKLLNQHIFPSGNDIDQWIQEPKLSLDWQFNHSDDKHKYLTELQSILAEQSTSLPEGFADIALMMADELIENSLYGAPRDRSDRALFSKGDERTIADYEGIHFNIRQNDEMFGLAMTDNWGTLTPSVFLNRLSLNASKQGGMEAGVGGTGMYLMWRFSDYLQVRVLPNRKTQVTLLWSLTDSSGYDSDSSFQFLYHTEADEVINNKNTAKPEEAIA